MVQRAGLLGVTRGVLEVGTWGLTSLPSLCSARTLSACFSSCRRVTSLALVAISSLCPALASPALQHPVHPSGHHDPYQTLNDW